MPRARILLLSANPDSTARLALDEEVRAIQVRLRQSGAAERIELCAEWALRAEELPAALMRHRPQVVHFSSHGSSAGELYLSSGKAGDVSPVGAETLRRIFEPLAGDISCVVLNACYSARQADLLAQILPCVVGMSKAVPDTAAIAFTAGFYEALAFGESVETAFKLGCAQIELAQQGAQREIPKLLLRPGTDAKQLRPFAAAALGSTTQVPSPFVAAASCSTAEVPTIALSKTALSSLWLRIIGSVALSLVVGGAGLAWWRSAHMDRMPPPRPPSTIKPGTPPTINAEGLSKSTPMTSASDSLSKSGADTTDQSNAHNIYAINFHWEKNDFSFPVLDVLIENRGASRTILVNLNVKIHQYKTIRDKPEPKILKPLSVIDVILPYHGERFMDLPDPIEIPPAQVARVQFRFLCKTGKKKIIPSDIGLSIFDLVINTANGEALTIPKLKL